MAGLGLESGASTSKPCAPSIRTNSMPSSLQSKARRPVNSRQLSATLKWWMSVIDPSLLSCLTFYPQKDLKVKVLVAQSCPTLCNPVEPSRHLHPWNSPGKNTGVGCHLLLQEIFLTQGLNLGLLHCRQTLYHRSHWGR